MSGNFMPLVERDEEQLPTLQIEQPIKPINYFSEKLSKLWQNSRFRIAIVAICSLLAGIIIGIICGTIPAILATERTIFECLNVTTPNDIFAASTTTAALATAINTATGARTTTTTAKISTNLRCPSQPPTGTEVKFNLNTFAFLCSTQLARPIDCEAIKSRNSSATSGFYLIYPASTRLNGFFCIPVYCDMDYGGGGWTVFQHRVSDSVDFFRNWTDYKNGFGDSNNFWLGNEYISRISTAPGNSYNLLIVMMTVNGTQYNAYYSGFRIDSAATNHTLRLERYVCGSAEDSLMYDTRADPAHQHNQPFSTFDYGAGRRCASQFHGAWWYNGNCYLSNLNGRYGVTNGDYGMLWGRISWSVGLAQTTMMIRRSAYTC